jgi:hypothetical protein
MPPKDQKDDPKQVEKALKSVRDAQKRFQAAEKQLLRVQKLSKDLARKKKSS